MQLLSRKVVPLNRAGRSFKRTILHFGVLVALTGSFLFANYPAAAQSGGRVVLSAVDTQAFPQITFIMEAYEGSGGFISGLQPEDVAILEDGKELSPLSIETQQPGLQVIAAFNIGPVMAGRTGGTSIFQKLVAALQDWADDQQPEGSDDFSLISNERLEAVRLDQPERWQQALRDFQPDLLKSKPGLSSLSQALDLAADPNARPNMKRALIYVTPPPAEGQLAALPNLAERAAQAGLRVFVWAVISPGATSGPGIDALQQLADQTGGQLFLFSGAETLPAPEAYFRPLRSVYQVNYLSAANRSGSHSLMLRLERGGRELLSPEAAYTIQVAPPNPIFLSPPAEVKRVFSNGSQKGQLIASPSSLALKILIEFPDGHPRALRSTRLLVDGSVAVERLSEPFDTFTWDLSRYESSESHRLQVQVIDSLGLEESSMEIPVQVVVEKPRPGLLQIEIDPKRLIIGGAVLAAGAALALALWFSGRKGWLTTDRRKRSRMLKDPVTQPVPIQQEQPRRKPAPALSWPRPGSPAKAPAWLIRLDEENRPVSGMTVPLLRKEISIGSNPQQAGCVLNFPSVDALHARLYTGPDGSFTLADAGSVAGTWVNYCPISSHGARLEHGDIIHFGQVAFRFEMADPPHQRQAQVDPFDETL